MTDDTSKKSILTDAMERARQKTMNNKQKAKTPHTKFDYIFGAVCGVTAAAVTFVVISRKTNWLPGEEKTPETTED